jgi:hypothetical protein
LLLEGLGQLKNPVTAENILLTKIQGKNILYFVWTVSFSAKNFKFMMVYE